MTPRDDYLCVTRLPTPAATPSAEQAPASNASPPPDAGAAPLRCAGLFCDEPPTRDDLCERHADLMKDLREEYYELQREFEAGW